MSLRWVREETPRWDERKQAVFEVEGPQVFGLGSPGLGDVLADEWWRVEDSPDSPDSTDSADPGTVRGYGRLDSVWGDAEILVAVAPEDRGGGIGAFVLEHLEAEAARRGLNYLYNSVPAGRADTERVTAWLRARGFADRGTGELRKQVARGAPPR